VSGARRKPVTYDDLVRVPEHLVAEIVGGELFTSPRPAAPHALAATGILGDLFNFHGAPGDPARPGGWWILIEPELHLQADVLVPDLAGWRHERMPVVPNVAAFTLPPDWLCEVISPSTAQLDRARKMQVYAREGVAHMWLVDPLARTLEIYRLEGGSWIVVRTHGGSDPVRAEPFDSCDIHPARWWPQP
jgi:Uma2 family endonuclease